MRDDLPAELTSLLEEFAGDVRATLGDNLVGLYARGSVAMGGFVPGYSDADLLIVTKTRVSDSEFEALREMHDRVRALANPYAAKLEAAYIDAEAARRYVPGQRHPMITTYEPFRWERHDSNWVLDRWQAREGEGSRLFGPDPRDVFDPISGDDLREAARARIDEWKHWADDIPAVDREWIEKRAHQAYVIETICRALYVLGRGTLPTKAQAVDWALGEMAGEARLMVERSQEWRTDETMDAATAGETLDFVRYAAGRASMSAE